MEFIDTSIPQEFFWFREFFDSPRTKVQLISILKDNTDRARVRDVKTGYYYLAGWQQLQTIF